MDKQSAELISRLSSVVVSAKNSTELSTSVADLLTSSLAAEMVMVVLLNENNDFIVSAVAGVSRGKKLELTGSCCVGNNMSCICQCRACRRYCFILQ
ncbi:MAG: hypothetical protein RBT37_04200 [Dissulfurispiraceae bacterium]|nr:hypothetical protein [Dissulfurispiraceae bacterium]